jgi:hypothetical protein
MFLIGVLSFWRGEVEYIPIKNTSPRIFTLFTVLLDSFIDPHHIPLSLTFFTSGSSNHMR